MKKKFELRGYALIPSSLLKLIRIMKLMIVIICGLGLLTSYGKSFSQSSKLSMDFQNTSIEDVLNYIEGQTDYSFMYDNRDVDVYKKVSINVSNESIEEILNQLFEKGIEYKEVGRHIIITPKKTAGQGFMQQQKRITGEVKDSAGLPLPGVTVFIKGTTQGTITDANGTYSLSNVAPDAVLVFSFVGMATKEIQVNEKGIINIIMEEDAIGIEEVVAVGYGVQKATTITGSVSSVKGEKLMAAPTINFSNSMAGRLPGLVAISRSGEPGSDGTTFRIRGANTLGNNSPLVVVDGIVNRGLERLNSADIESVSVLKDASAAIYGAQAANGVILITTKRGKEGKPTVSISYDEGISMPTVLPETADAATYLEMLNEINVYAGQAPLYSAEEIQKYRDGSDPWRYPNTDWYAETFQKAASQRSANVKISGGQENLKYYISVGTKYQEAIYKNSATNFNQTNFRVNLDGKISEHIKYGIDLAGQEYHRNYPTRSASAIFQALRRGYPHVPAYWPNGKNGPDIESGNNPVVITTNQTGYDRNKTMLFQSKANLVIDIPWVKGLKVTGNVALDKEFGNNKLWEVPWYLYSWDGSSLDENGQPLLREGKKGFTSPQLTQDMFDRQTVVLNALANYETSINNKHNIKVLVGSERISGESMNFSAFRKDFVSTAIDELFAGADAEKTNNGSSDVSARMNYFGRVNYGYMDKYLLEFVWRVDGSYIFPRGKRFGFFPGASLGWRVSEEDFWENIKPVINSFKVRGSWGQTGNDRIDTYQFLSSYAFSKSTNWVYTFNSNVENKVLQELRVPNINVTWEVANQSNIGADVQLLDGKIALSGEYFYNLRTNILWNRNASVPESTGLTLPRENIGKVVNQGSEFQVTYRNTFGDLNLGISANVNFNKNRIKFWDETPGVPDYQESTGHPMNSDLYYRAIGIFRDQAAIDAYPHWSGARPGDIIFEDVNGDEVIDGLDRVRIYKTDLPTQTGGFNIDLEYKNFYSSIFFQWATGAVRNNYYQLQGEAGNFLKQDVEGRWTEDNIDASKPRIWNRYAEYWRNNQNTYWLQNSDYIRLKNLEVGYNVPKNVCNRIALDGIQVYFTGLNLLTFTKIKDFDPESNSATSYPLNKVYNLGVTLTF